MKNKWMAEDIVRKVQRATEDGVATLDGTVISLSHDHAWVITFEYRVNDSR